jgi:hypothetical protein
MVPYCEGAEEFHPWGFVFGLDPRRRPVGDRIEGGRHVAVARSSAAARSSSAVVLDARRTPELERLLGGAPRPRDDAEG